MIKPEAFDSMKILFTVHQFFPEFSSGTEVLTLSVARELMERGYDVHVFSGHPSEAQIMEENRFDEYDYEGIHVYRFHHAYTPMFGQISMVDLSYNNTLAAKYFEQVLEIYKPDLVHFFHLNRLGTGLIDLAVRTGIPAFMTPTDFWAICPTAQLLLCNGDLCQGPNEYAGNCVKHYAESTKNGLIGNLAKWLPTTLANLLVRLTQANLMPPYPHRIEVHSIGSRLGINVARLNQLKGIISPNQFMSEKLVQHGVIPDLIVHSAFGVDVVNNVEDLDCHLPRHPLRVGFIGTLIPHKGCHVLIKAFKSLSSGQAVLKVYGNMDEIPEYSNALKRLADNNDAIEFCGTFHNSKIGKVLAELDVLVVPSLWYENTPLVIYSAQAARCPVIASNFPGISEVIRDEVNGLLFEADNVMALTKQLTRLIEETSLLNKLSSCSATPKSTATYVDELLSTWIERK